MRIYPNTTVDYEFQQLGSLGHSGSLNDRQFSLLRTSGYTGALADMLAQYLNFSPLNLFTSSEQGAWLDPSDLSTLFQDDAGTTPVTAAGQTVALALDKSRGLVLGPDIETDDWSAPLSGVSYSSGVFTFDGATSQTNVVFSTNTPSVAIVAGRTYQVSFTIFSNTTLPVGVDVGGVIGDAQTNPGTYTRLIIATSTTGPQVRFRDNIGLRTGAMGNISVRELPGFHATQSTAASRPTYGVVPSRGRVNLLTFTEQFDVFPWVPFSASISANAAASPIGTATADKLVPQSGVSGGYVAQTAPVVAGQAYTLSFFAKADGLTILRVPDNGTFMGNNVEFNLSTGVASLVSGSATFSMVAAGGGWYRCIVTGTASATGDAGKQIRSPVAGDGTSGILLWGAQLETGSTATTYQRVVSQFEVTDPVGFPSYQCHYLSFDGVDDFLVTPTITPNADKVQVFAGVRKLSDAARAVVAELTNAATGRFSLEAPQGAAANYGFASGGSTPVTAASAASFAAPETAVLTGIGDIAADTLSLRRNGTQIVTSANDQGTGNYATARMWIGRRGGASLPFNGPLYGLIARFGPNLTADQISQTERWMAQRTGVVL